MSWATLMKRVFEIDVLECPVCQGPMKIIAEITQRDVIRRFLAALDLPTEAPRVQRARPPPQLDLGWDDGPADSMVDDDASMLQSGA